MQVSVEKVSSVLYRMTITVPADEVELAYTTEINQLAKTACIKGFRPGKAPKHYVEQHFGGKVRQEALGQVMKQALYDAITEKNMEPISLPQIEPKVVSAHQPLEFIASFEVLPPIEAVQFSPEKIEKLVVSIHAEDIDYVLQQFRKQYTKWRAVERAAQEKDRIVIDYDSIVAGEAERHDQDVTIELGRQVMIPGFEEGLIGILPGEERTLHLCFPADSPVSEQAGQPVEFRVRVKKIFEAEVPNLDEPFMQQLGISSGRLEDLKEQVQQSLEQERNRLVRTKLKEQIFQHLLDQNPIEVPPTLIQREARHIHDEIYQHQHSDHHLEEEVAAFNEVAKKRVAVSLLMTELAKQAELTVDGVRVQDRIREIASAYDNPEAVIEWLSSDRDKRKMIELQIMEEQLTDQLMTQVPIVEKIMSYAELKGIRYD